MADERANRPDIDAEWESLARYLSGESSPDEERRLREELERHPERAALVGALDAALSTVRQEPLSSAEVERALEAVRARAALDVAPVRDGVIPIRDSRATQLARSRWQWRTAGLRAAAAVLVVAGGSMIWRASRNTSPESRASVSVAASHYATIVGKVDSIRLSDGSRVVLGPASTLDVAAGFGASARSVTLSGVAFFDVVHDERVPFVVHTAQATMRDVGTSFSVHADVAGGTRVAVTNGAVDVAAGSGAGQSVVLHAGDRAVATDGGVRLDRSAGSVDDLSWTRGVLVFRDAPLGEVSAGLRRWYGIQLVVTDSIIASRRLTATFDRGSPDEVGSILATALGGSVRRSGDTLRIGSPNPAP